MASSGGDRPTMSGPKGFAIMIGGMLGILLLLWGLLGARRP